MATIYQQSIGALTPQSGRSASTFSSGLVRVDRKFVCATVDAATHRSTLTVGNDMPDGNSVPAIDGLKIFPAPQEIERGDGFTDFIVSAYGRTSSDMSSVELIQRNVDAFNAGGGGGGTYDFGYKFSLWEIKGKAVIKAGIAINIDDLNIDSDLLEPFNVQYRGNELTVLSVTAGETSTRYVRSDDGDPFSRITSYKTITSRKYTIIFTADGVTPTKTWVVYLGDPIITITGQQNFGEFTEVDILTRREIVSDTTLL